MSLSSYSHMHSLSFSVIVSRVAWNDNHIWRLILPHHRASHCQSHPPKASTPPKAQGQNRTTPQKHMNSTVGASRRRSLKHHKEDFQPSQRLRLDSTRGRRRAIGCPIFRMGWLCFLVFRTVLRFSGILGIRFSGSSIEDLGWGLGCPA